MRIRPALLIAVAITMVITGLVPVAADDLVRPTFRTQDVWFECDGPTKVHQVNWLAALGNPSSFPRWSTNPPSQSVTDGAGCGAADHGGVNNSVYSPIFHGYVEGNVHSMTVRLHNLLPGHTRQGQDVQLAVHLEVDGQSLFTPGGSEGGRVWVTPQPSESGASEVLEFTITNLGFADEVLDADGEVVEVDHGGLAKEDGDGTREHEILLTVGLAAYPQPGAWVWGSTEVPSGITFNPEERSEAAVQAQLPK